VESFINIRLVQSLKLITDMVIVYAGHRWALSIGNDPVNFDISVLMGNDICWLFIFPAVLFYLFGLYSERRTQYAVFMTLSTAFSLSMLCAAYPFMHWGSHKEIPYSRFVVAACIQFCGIAGFRILFSYLLGLFQRSKRVLVIETELPRTMLITEQLKYHKGLYVITDILLPWQRNGLETDH
jgi:hypothetical protein